MTRLKKQQLGTKYRMEPRFQSKVEQILIFQLLKLRNRFHQRVNLEFSSIRTLGLKDMWSYWNATLAIARCFSGNGTTSLITLECTLESVRFCALNHFAINLLLRRLILTSISLFIKKGRDQLVASVEKAFKAITNWR